MPENAQPAVSNVESTNMDEVRALLERLVPPETVELADVYGNKYTVRPVLSARRQIAVLRHAEKLMNLAAGTVDGMTFDVGNIGAILIRLADNERVLDVLCDAFEAAHPQVVIHARSVAESDENHVADLFPVEEIVGGLVPFCVRLATKLLDMAAAIVPNPTTESAAA
jgi:hypothetical protein